MAISGISGISAYAPISSIKPMNMPLEAQSEVSSAYTDSVKGLSRAQSANPVSSVSPVRYPNAIETDDEGKEDKGITSATLNKAFNKIAAGFGNAVTGYSRTGAGQGYAQLGTAIDIGV